MSCDPERIKATVTLPDAIARFAPEITIKRSRCPCPIHHGDGYNMAVYPDHFYCHVCHASGDVISFVMQLLNLDFQAACALLSDDFGINDKPQSRGARIRAVRAREAAEAKQSAIRRKQIKRDDTLAELAVLLDVREGTEPLSDTWCWCTKRIERCWCIIDEIGLEV